MGVRPADSERRMQSSMFNVRVPLPERGEVFLMNTLTDAQAIVSNEVAQLLDRLPGESVFAGGRLAEERKALDELRSNGFVVPDREADLQALERFFHDVREDTREMNVTILTTLQCNFACTYCFQGDHGHFTQPKHKMSVETADRVVAWTEARLDEVKPGTLTLTFFGGEPLLNLPPMYRIAEQLWSAAEVRGIPMYIEIITNGLLLTPEIVDRLTPYGLTAIKVTLDGDRAAHDRMRPLRGGQGTFDRIVENVRRVADRVGIAVGGNFDESSADSIPALLDFLKEQPFADKLLKVNFKPIIGEKPAPARPENGMIPLQPVGAGGKPLGGACMTTAGAGNGSLCQDCHFAAEKTSFLREETKKRGFSTADGVHMGPCHLHQRHAYAIGPDGSLYACPGFASEETLATGHVADQPTELQTESAERFEHLSPWRRCGDCAFIPVCAGGCSTASHNETGDMSAPLCHKSSMETALVALAHETAANA